MALRRILQINDPEDKKVLKTRCFPVKLPNPGLKQLIADMFETMHAANGVGLAAPQIGITQRLAVIYIPPEVEEQEDGTVVEIAPEDPAGADARALLDASDAYAAGLYPAESNHMLDVESLRRPEVTFLVARAGGRALGCGAILRCGADWAEIKRMFVAPEARGLKVGRRLLDRLEAIAAGEGLRLLRLETGIRQPEALGLYRSAGFAEIGPFGSYGPDPLSVFMEKRIGA